MTAETPEKPDWSAVVRGMAERARAARDPQAEEERAAWQAQLAADRHRRLYAQHQRVLETVPPRYASGAADDPEVRRWIEGCKGGSSLSLYLTGPVGSGKTWQAYAAFRELVVSDVGSGVHVTVPAFLDGLRPGRPGTTDYDEVEGADLLLLDDLAAERVSDWTLEVLYRLIDHRWAHRQPTIITSNVPPSSVREVLGDRIASRLAGMARVVALTGGDRRRP